MYHMLTIVGQWLYLGSSYAIVLVIYVPLPHLAALLLCTLLMYHVLVLDVPLLCVCCFKSMCLSFVVTLCMSCSCACTFCFCYIDAHATFFLYVAPSHVLCCAFFVFLCAALVVMPPKKRKDKSPKKSGNELPWKIRFGAKRLRNFVENNLSPAKQAVIATTCFAGFLRISKFNVPDELLEWVVMNIDANLCEYRYKNSRPIVFTRGMMQKVFNIPGGNRPVERLNKHDHPEIRNIYRDGGDRAPIATLESLLESCDDTDEVMIKRSFALLVFSTVLFLGTSNMVPLDYIGSLLDMDRMHEYAWDEAVLQFCMLGVVDFQKKRRAQLLTPGAAVKQFTIGSCLPALVVCFLFGLSFLATP